MQEDIIGITDSNHNILCSYEYDSWGNIITIKDNNGNIITDESHIGIINPYRYRSYYYDKETKLYYLNSRYYSPEWGRFISTDIYLGCSGDILGYNLYLYVSNNPINNVDDTGRLFKKAWNWVKEKAKQATKAVKNVVNKAISTAKKTISKVKKFVENVKKSFVFEAEAGLGLEIDFKIANQGAKIGFDKTIGYNNKNGQYTSTNAGFEMKVATYRGGYNLNVRNYDGGNGNPATMPWEIWNNENTVFDNTVGLKKEFGNISDFSNEASGKSHFIGVNFGLFVFGGGRIKIGFNIGE